MKKYALVLSSLFILESSFSATIPRDCGTEITDETSLSGDFGVQPSTLPYYSDSQAIQGIGANPNNLVFDRIAMARTIIWYDVLVYRLEEDNQYFYVIPAESGYNTWRYGKVTHPTSGVEYDIVHWLDIDDGSYTFYFRKNTTTLCKVVFEN